MTDFKIESGIPVPQAARGARVKYPLEKLAVGDSFFIPVSDANKAKNLRSSFAVRSKKIGIKVVSVFENTEQPHGVRVWRIDPSK
jgi:hypothetical protein